VKESKKKPYKRKIRNFLIYPRFQLGLLGVQAFVMILTFGIMQMENHAAFARLAQMGLDASLNQNHAYFHFVEDQSHAFFSHTLIAFVSALLLSSGITLYLSFRLAGPIYRLRNHMKKVAEEGIHGLEPLRFRAGDFYSDLPPIINNALERFRRDE
jgi:hypothetical protein